MSGFPDEATISVSGWLPEFIQLKRPTSQKCDSVSDYLSFFGGVMRKSFAILICFGLATIAATSVLSQAPPSDVVIGSGSFSPIVADLEKSLAFYNDLLGGTPPAATPA